MCTARPITNEEHKKLSKRSGHSSYQDLIDQGFISEAVVNFVALLGWSPENNQEIILLRRAGKRVQLQAYQQISGCFRYGKTEMDERRVHQGDGF